MNLGLRTKKCSSCKKVKSLEEFHRSYTKSSGYDHRCKECAKERSRLYRSLQSEDRKKELQKYSRRKVWLKNYYHRHKDRISARDAVRYAIEKGTLAKLPCTECGSIVNVQAHHHKGYENKLDVQWLCQVHHSKVHYG